MVTFGTSLPGVQQIPARVRPFERALGGADLVLAAQAAERAGFAWVSCSDHVAVPVSRAGAMGATWYDAGSTLAFVAGATTRVRLLSHVLVLPYRHPLVVAKQFGTLDRLSDGRVILGVGSGHLTPEFRILGADYARRGQVTDDYVRAIAAAWEHEVAAFAGATIGFRDVLVSPRPSQRPRPPIWVGGNSRAALRRAARLGDGWVPWEISAADYASAAAYAREERVRAGRSAAFELVAPIGVSQDASADAVLAEAAAFRRAGATAFHAGVAADGFERYLDRLEWIGREILTRLP